MGRNGEGEGTAASECCMCGDYGLSSELFTCKHCRFRSQHKYCSNEYPEAESYNVCNWCLISQKGDVYSKGDGNAKTSSPHSSSSSHKATGTDDIKMNKRKRGLLRDDRTHVGAVKDIKTTNGNQIKKHINKFPPANQSGPSAGRKRITPGTRPEENISNGGMIIKQVFRHKVRRYKLLDEVSS